MTIKKQIISTLGLLALVSTLSTSAAARPLTYLIKYGPSLEHFEVNENTLSSDVLEYNIDAVSYGNSATVKEYDDGEVYESEQDTYSRVRKAMRNGLKSTIELTKKGKGALVKLTFFDPSWRGVYEAIDLTVKAKFIKGTFDDIMKGEEVLLKITDKKKLKKYFDEILFRTYRLQLKKSNKIDIHEKVSAKLVSTSKPFGLIGFENKTLTTNFLLNSKAKIQVK